MDQLVGNLLIIFESIEIIFTFQVKKTVHVHPVEFKGREMPTVVSRSTIYHLEANSHDLEPCGRDYLEPCGPKECCNKGASFDLFAPDQCLLKIMCDSFEGNICGSFGIKVDLFGQEKDKSHDLCYTDVTIKSEFHKGDKLEINLWYVTGNQSENHFYANCYMWCTPDGNLPSAPNDTPDSVSLTNMVSSVCTLFSYAIKNFTT